jgi:ribosomal protein S18 acetylase RimI-like enzyme
LLLNDWALNTGLQAGLLGNITAAHGKYYADKWGFGVFFEAKVARECGGFLERAQPDDLVLSAWQNSVFLGSMIVDLHDPDAHDMAHLRWFIVSQPGLGIGRAMMARAVQHLDGLGKACFLTTFSGLDAARKLYEDFGFVLVEETESQTWGISVAEQRFERAGRNAA